MTILNLKSNKERFDISWTLNWKVDRSLTFGCWECFWGWRLRAISFAFVFEWRERKGSCSTNWIPIRWLWSRRRSRRWRWSRRSNDGELSQPQLWRCEVKELVRGGASAMEEALWDRQESQAEVPFHRQPIQALRGRGYATYQSGLSPSVSLYFLYFPLSHSVLWRRKE